MEPVRINITDFKLNNFINYYEDNAKEMIFEYQDSVVRVNLIDKDYMDVITFDEDYEDLQEANDYKEVLLNEEYALHFIIGKTHEGAEKFEFIDGTKYSMKHYLDDLYMDKNSIKDIGDLKLNLDHLVGLLIDVEDGEYVMSITNYEKGLSPRIEEVEESGDLEDIVKNLINRFTA
ncbi:hypothetical protein [Romboutsia sp.]|uniref:hypothetical protein n=1 Tax=Romboutsia sp. TaxID=1965302 RepID=UPI002C7F7E0C|nr:hypothetical protein [Romboutsia sp.]HSQ89548.1 hypothetical protein [Romboutsia sp.]